MPRNCSAALPLTHGALRLLIVLNWLYGAAVLAVLTATVVAEAWTMPALGIPDASEIRRLLMPLRAIALLGLIAVPLNHAVLRRLLRVVESVCGGNPFVAMNAERLKAIAWTLLALQLLSMLIGGIGDAVSTRTLPVAVDTGFSTSGWLAVLLTFVLARIFAEGALMREDLEGTV
jgi:hypothetical protein